MPRDKPYHPGTLHFGDAQRQALSPRHTTLQEATTWPKDISYCPVHCIHFRRPLHSPGTYPIDSHTAYPSGGHSMAKGTALQSLQCTLASDRAYPWYPVYPAKSSQPTRLQTKPANKTANQASQQDCKPSQPTRLQIKPANKNANQANQQDCKSSQLTKQQISKTTK